MVLDILSGLKQAKLRAAVIGSTGGIGSALVQCLAQSDDVEVVYALSRTENRAFSTLDKTRWHQLDLLDETTISEAAEKIKSEGELDFVIIASGILHGDGAKPEKDWRMLDPETMANLFVINTIGPALVLKHFAPLLSKTGRPVMAVLSARVGSISDNRLGGWYSYRASKAALNQIIRTFSIELARKNKDAVILGLHPGTVATELSKPYQANSYERFTPQQSAEYLLSVVNKAEPSMSGKVYDWKGEEIPA